MPREFIPNIDTANEEIVRLDARIAELETASESLLNEQGEALAAVTVARDEIIVARDQAISERDALRTERDGLAGQLAAANKRIDEAVRNSAKAAAAAGADPIPQADSEKSERAAENLTGAARLTAYFKKSGSARA